MTVTTNTTYLCDESRHLICIPYSLENLHAMAEDLGLGRHWFHKGKYPHYDIPKRRKLEIMSKCRVVGSRELVLLIKQEVKETKYSGLTQNQRRKLINLPIKYSLVTKNHGNKIRRAPPKQRA